jgi:hypothetical protein
MTDWSEEDKEAYRDWKVTIAEEDLLIEQLRDELDLEVELDHYWDHEQLRRFLRARKHDILKAKTMVKRTAEWRIENEIDTILEDFDFHEREAFHAHYPEGFFCTDKFGRPVYVQKPGDIDCNELWKFTDLERSVKHHIQQQERYVKIIAPSAAHKAGDRRAFQSMVIIDMDGVGVSTLTGEVRTIMGRIMQIDQDYYPVGIDLDRRALARPDALTRATRFARSPGAHAQGAHHQRADFVPDNLGPHQAPA